MTTTSTDTPAVELNRKWVEGELNWMLKHSAFFCLAGRCVEVAAADYIALCRSWLARQDEGWQPIETAPDGERILAYWPSDKSIETVMWDRAWYEEMDGMPTCWRPLPEPPDAALSKETK